jgi:hypothetical protein
MARKVIISRLAKPNIDGPQSCGVDERAEATMSEVLHASGSSISVQQSWCNFTDTRKAKRPILQLLFLSRGSTS